MSGKLTAAIRSKSLKTSISSECRAAAPTQKPHRKLVMLIVVWFVACFGGAAVLFHYSSIPGEAGTAPPDRLPASANDADSHYALLMFVHPHCGCSRASIRQLERILARCQGRVSTRIYFYSPDSRSAAWAQSGLWTLARTMPDVSRLLDSEGLEADRFGVATSGHVLLYDARRKLRFSGGITASRGHEGDNTGSRSVQAIIRDEPDFETKTPVFGCRIHRAEAQEGRHEDV